MKTRSRALAALVMLWLAGCGSGSAPDAGSAATARQNPSQSPSPKSKAETFARAGVVLGSCAPDDGVNRNLANLWHADEIPQLWGRFGRQAECLATAGGGCAALTHCIGYHIERNPSCAPGCSGSTLTQCDHGVAVSIDCGKVGLSCDEQAGCVDGSAMSCDDASYVASCDASGQPLTCDHGLVHRGPDCAALGLRCDTGACRGQGEPCKSDPPNSQYRVDYVGIATTPISSAVAAYRTSPACSRCLERTTRSA